MDSSTVPVLSQALGEKNGSSDLKTMNQMVVLEPDKIQELNQTVPGMWRLPTNSLDLNPDLCCIYRVPNCIREVNPKAYTPQLAVIGPLHHCLKSQALKSLGDITNTKSMGYLNVEEHKKFYLAEFARKVGGRKTIDGFRRIIKEDETIIRASYSESTAWIQSSEFVEMILHDSVFILELILRQSVADVMKTRDPLTDMPCLERTIMKDLILLENQLPYFILEKLFDPIVSLLRPNKTLRKIVIKHFRLEKGKIGDNSKFRHFTDLLRCVCVDKFKKHDGFLNYKLHMHNADKLYSSGVNFEVMDESQEEEELSSVEVKFKHGCLKIPCFTADDKVEIKLRNIMALEQCHYPFTAYVCSYVVFLDFLVDSDKDVDLLVEKGIIKHWNRHQGLVTEMINKLCVGVVDNGSSYYSDLVKSVNKRYENPFFKSFGILRRVYFNNIWKGTATIAAIFILLLTLTQTVIALIEILQKKKK